MCGQTPIKCNVCVEEYLKLPEEDRSSGWLSVNDADTYVPVWQTKTMMGQLLAGVIPMPVCIKHIVMRKPSAEEQAARNGVILPGG
jgi:hypothetical protein